VSDALPAPAREAEAMRAPAGEVATRPTPGTPIDGLCLGVLALAGYYLANNGGFMYFNYHLHLAVSLLDGRLYIANPPSWLTEFAFHEGKPYVYFDPFPAVFLLPFAAIWGLTVNIAHVAIVVGAFNVLFTRFMLGALRVERAIANWCTLLFTFGTVHLFAAQYGNTWLLAHLLAVTCLTLAWIEGIGAANPVLLGLLASCAATSRSPTLLGVPVLLVLSLGQRPRVSTAILFFVPLALTACLLGAYNFARFGDWFNNGYLMANQAILQPQFGSFSWHYIAQNVTVYFLRLPGLSSTWPYLTLTDHGLSLIATTPAVLLLLRPGWSPRLPDAPWYGRLALAGSALIFGLYMCYFWDGWRQFGARYTLDFTPFLIVALALRCDGRRSGRWLLPVLAVLSIAVNVWGAWWWRIHRW